MKLIFCDIDGTLTETFSGQPFKQNPYDVKVIPAADYGLQFFRQRGWTIVGISNQGGVGAGHKTLDDAIEEMAYTKQLFPEICRIFFCPDFEGKKLFNDLGVEVSARKDCSRYNFRKPNPGMILYFLDATRIEKMLSLIWMIGDRPEDEECAKNAEINFCPASNFHARFTPGVHEVSHSTPALLDFLEIIDGGIA